MAGFLLGSYSLFPHYNHHNCICTHYTQADKVEELVEDRFNSGLFGIVFNEIVRDVTDDDNEWTGTDSNSSGNGSWSDCIWSIR